MAQSDMYRSVARATGESVSRIRRMGFSLLVMPIVCRQPRRRPKASGRHEQCPRSERA